MYGVNVEINVLLLLSYFCLDLVFKWDAQHKQWYDEIRELSNYFRWCFYQGLMCCQWCLIPVANRIWSGYQKKTHAARAAHCQGLGKHHSSSWCKASVGSLVIKHNYPCHCVLKHTHNHVSLRTHIHTCTQQCGDTNPNTQHGHVPVSMHSFKPMYYI